LHLLKEVGIAMEVFTTLRHYNNAFSSDDSGSRENHPKKMQVWGPWV
jgi:hypothetical protein